MTVALPLSDWRIQTVSSLRSSRTALHSAGVKFLLGGFARLIASQILILAILLPVVELLNTAMQLQ